MGRVRTVPSLCALYPGICLTTREKARKNLSQSRKTLSQGMFQKIRYVISSKKCATNEYVASVYRWYTDATNLSSKCGGDDKARDFPSRRLSYSSCL
jgi:hypothetical protein